MPEESKQIIERKVARLTRLKKGLNSKFEFIRNRTFRKIEEIYFKENNSRIENYAIFIMWNYTERLKFSDQLIEKWKKLIEENGEKAGKIASAFRDFIVMKKVVISFVPFLIEKSTDDGKFYETKIMRILNTTIHIHRELAHEEISDRYSVEELKRIKIELLEYYKKTKGEKPYAKKIILMCLKAIEGKINQMKARPNGIKKPVIVPKRREARWKAAGI